jgi:hypothetical protein
VYLFINGAFAVRNFDLSSKTRGLAVPYYYDFTSYSSGNTLKVSVSVNPDTTRERLNAVMNGIEIMKISNNVDSLYKFSSFQSFSSSVLHSPKKSLQRSRKLGIWWTIILTGCGVCILAFLSFCYLKSHRRKKSSVSSFKFLRHFTLHEM